MRELVLLLSILGLAVACGETAPGTDAGSPPTDGGRADGGGTRDAGPALDGGGASDAGGSSDGGDTSDAGGSSDGGSASDAGGPSDAGSASDAGTIRSVLFPGFCPGTVTAPGLYRGTLASNTNDIASVSGCGSLSSPGRDGSVRLELTPGQRVSATYRHAGDGVLYILDRCPVTSSCLDGSDSSLSGAETVAYTNDTGVTNTVYVVLDSDSLSGPQTFELDLSVTVP